MRERLTRERLTWERFNESDFTRATSTRERLTLERFPCKSGAMNAAGGFAKKHDCDYALWATLSTNPFPPLSWKGRCKFIKLEVKIGKIASGRGTSKVFPRGVLVVHQGFIFRKDQVKGNSINWKCSLRNCKGRLVRPTHGISTWSSGRWHHSDSERRTRPCSQSRESGGGKTAGRGQEPCSSVSGSTETDCSGL